LNSLYCVHLDALARDQRHEVVLCNQLGYDLSATDELAVNVNLREAVPLGELSEPLVDGCVLLTTY
jgi:hypothetical protein